MAAKRVLLGILLGLAAAGSSSELAVNALDNVCASRCVANQSCNICYSYFEDVFADWHNVEHFYKSSTLLGILKLAWRAPARGFDSIAIGKFPILLQEHLPDIKNPTLRNYTACWITLSQILKDYPNPVDHVTRVLSLPFPAEDSRWPLEVLLWTLSFPNESIKKVMRSRAFDNNIVRISEILCVSIDELTVIVRELFADKENANVPIEELYRLYTKCGKHLHLMRPDSSVVLHALANNQFTTALNALHGGNLDVCLPHIWSMSDTFVIVDASRRILSPPEAAAILTAENVVQGPVGNSVLKSQSIVLDGRQYMRKSLFHCFLDGSLLNSKRLHNCHLFLQIVPPIYGVSEDKAMLLMLEHRWLWTAVNIVLHVMRAGIYEQDVALGALAANPTATVLGANTHRFDLLFKYNLTQSRLLSLLRNVTQVYVAPTWTKETAKTVVSELIGHRIIMRAIIYAIEYCTMQGIDLIKFLAECRVPRHCVVPPELFDHVGALCTALYAPMHATRRCMCDTASLLLPIHKRAIYAIASTAKLFNSTD